MAITKTFVEHNKTVKIILNDYGFTIIEIHDYSSGVERVSVNLDYDTYDFYYVIELYKKDMLAV